MMLQLPRAARAGGFTLFELAVVTSIIGILAAALLNSVLFYQAQAERVAAQQMAGTLRSALHLQVASLIAKGREKEIAGLVEQNPMDWLAEKPGNYSGDFYSPKESIVSVGHWYFDRADKKLIYLYNHGDFASDTVGNKLKFKVKLATMKSGSVRNVVGADEEISGVILEQLSP
jgi:prepilin-type N-terminal cleavage/methylation domain-containing protein